MHKMWSEVATTVVLWYRLQFDLSLIIGFYATM